MISLVAICLHTNLLLNIFLMLYVMYFITRSQYLLIPFTYSTQLPTAQPFGSRPLFLYVSICLCLCTCSGCFVSFLAMPRSMWNLNSLSMWNLNSLTSDRTADPCSASVESTTGLPGESLFPVLFLRFHIKVSLYNICVVLSDFFHLS